MLHYIFHKISGCHSSQCHITLILSNNPLLILSTCNADIKGRHILDSTEFCMWIQSLRHYLDKQTVFMQFFCQLLQSNNHMIINQTLTMWYKSFIKHDNLCNFPRVHQVSSVTKTVIESLLLRLNIEHKKPFTTISNFIIIFWLRNCKWCFFYDSDRCVFWAGHSCNSEHNVHTIYAFLWIANR